MNLSLAARLRVFAALEELSALRQRLRSGSAQRPVASASTAPPSLWLFVSTIGELNAVAPLLQALRQRLRPMPLTLLTDRSIYQDAYRSRHPDAAIELLDGSMGQMRALARRRPPALLVVAEIPGLLHDAPCRLSYAALHEARRAGAPCVLINGWLYGYAPPSRLDLLAQRWFADDYLQAFDLMLVQTDAVRQRLLDRGAAAQRVHTVGNVKFDAMPWPPQPPELAVASHPLGQALLNHAQGPVLVAGSVTETDQQAQVLAALARVRQQHPGALLVLAPRHPENQPRMAALRDLLERSGLPWCLRSSLPAQPGLALRLQPGVLVLDTIGELRGCYAAAALAFVGVDHNVLEPLGFGRPVFVCEGWEPTYPSYPVYQQLRAVGAIHDVGPLSALGEAWCAHLDAARNDNAHDERLGAAIRSQRGAVQRHLQAMQDCAALQPLLGGATAIDGPGSAMRV